MVDHTPMMVDLPAPVLPTTATTLPGTRSNDTSSKTLVPFWNERGMSKYGAGNVVMVMPAESAVFDV